MSDHDEGQGAGAELPGGATPGVFLLPFALPEPIDGLKVDAEILARRLPDVLHQLLNAGRSGPAGMLEVHSAPGEGPPRWVTLSSVPSPDEVHAMLGGHAIRALVAGSMRRVRDGLAVDLAVHVAGTAEASEDGEGVEFEGEGFHHGIRAVLALDDPIPGVIRLGEHLASVLRLPFGDRARGLLTRNPVAFYSFLEGLDGAALLTSDPDLESDRYGDDLLGPFAEALQEDPGFGLALRALGDALFPALLSERISRRSCLRLLDRVLIAEPTDGEGCASVAEHLSAFDEEDRAREWLEHAAGLAEPPARALEALGVLFANDGENEVARELWLRGLEVDGHPDFFAHLGRLAFAESRPVDGWEAMRRGLWRKLERERRAAEWDDDRSGGVLFRYLEDVLTDGAKAPGDVVETVTDFVGLLADPVERIDLGLCLVALGRPVGARRELEAALAESELPTSAEDRAVRGLLLIAKPDFERRFAAAAARAERGRNPRPALLEMQAYLELQPRFWPALLHAGIALRRLGQADEALDAVHEVVRRRPEQAEAHVELGRLFFERGNAKRGLECAEDAIERGAGGVAEDLKARCLIALGRSAEIPGDRLRRLRVLR
ncbi:MAG: tetratricopeptide repeat protein [Planctomycetota bacterium]|nr:tetratricopeptide repeat protein [Planctomycetota bacterium]